LAHVLKPTSQGTAAHQKAGSLQPDQLASASPGVDQNLKLPNIS